MFLCYTFCKVTHMRKVKTTPELEEEITRLYAKIEEKLKERGLSWSKLAVMCGLNRRTLVSMRAQLINPSWTTVVKIARALDISLDELTDGQNKTQELFDYYWAVPRLFPDYSNQSMICRQALMLAQSARDTMDGKQTERMIVRTAVSKEEAAKRFKEAEKAETESESENP